MKAPKGGTLFMNVALVVLLLIACGRARNDQAETPAATADTLIVGALVIDGTGEPGRITDVRISGDLVVAAGSLEIETREVVIDGTNLVLAPGFIDVHSHADADLLERPDARAAVSQGITTVIGGADGDSRFPLAEFFDRLESAPPAVNLASFAGHNTYRAQILGDDFRRVATNAEIEQMRQLLAADLEAGALGLSTGLEYDPGIYSNTDEVVELAREAARHGGTYTSHIRSEDRRFWGAVDEILTIGREAKIPVNITHVKLAMRSTHGQTERLYQQLDQARAGGVEVTVDLYPYTYWQSTLEVLFPERDFQNRDSARFAISEVTSPEHMLVPYFKPEPALAGSTLAEIAELRGTDAASTLMDLIRQAQDYRDATGEEDIESVIAVSMDEQDLEEILRWPFVSVCTDGGLWGSHPRGFGAFTRILGRYVRERGVVSLEQAIHKMTGFPAATFGLGQRGSIRPGARADLVLFDPATILDRATTDDPRADSQGVVKVWVNGEVVWDGNEVSGRRPGRVLRRGLS